MNFNTCNNCGADYYFIDGRRRCLACGTVMAKGYSAKKKKLVFQAYSLLRESRFDEAKIAFEAILKKDPENADAYWGRCRARYHISYVLGPNEKLVPKCPTLSGANIFEDTDYRNATEYADEETGKFLRTQAEYIKTSCTEFSASKNLVNRFPLGEIDPNDAFPVKPKNRLFRTNLSENAIQTIKIVKVLAISIALIVLISTALKYWTGAAPMYSRNGLTLYSNGNGTFRVADIGNSTDTRIEIPSSYLILPVTTIGDWAFWGCDQMTDVVIPASVNHIGNWAFSDCTGLTSVTIPEGVTTIGAYAFDCCSNLTSIEIPESVTTIDVYAFGGCKRLSTIRFGGTVAQWNEITFGGNWDYEITGYTVFCTDGSVSK